MIAPRPFCCLAIVFTGLLLTSLPTASKPCWAQTRKLAIATDADRQLSDYFAAETAKLQAASLANVQTAADWNSTVDERRRQLREMLGLDPLPERTDLQATITGRLDHPEFTVENLHYQSSPGLYVTGNLYLPKVRPQPVPAVLYVCGHARVVKDGVSYGGKAHYQHHGAWLARNGYACLIIDTLQLGEIEGFHHGTHHLNRWWWLSRGYCPAGVEAWNCIRALDYLQSRPEIDGQRLGVSGRSGGGAYSWWISALDERIQAAVPVAGTTDLHNHVVDGCVGGHCDCMYMVNTYRWDYPEVVALNYPRPLLLSNTDRDPIFPLDGVYRTYVQVRRLYDLEKRGPLFALNITAGGHVDTQELQIHAIRWFDQHLRHESRLIPNAAEKLFAPEQLRVFTTLPADQRNTTIDETFVPVAPAAKVPQTADQWQQQRDEWRQALLNKTFAGWPQEPTDLQLRPNGSQEFDGLRLSRWEFLSQEHVRLTLYTVQRAELPAADLIVLNPLDQNGWDKFQAMFVEQAATLFSSSIDNDPQSQQAQKTPTQSNARNPELTAEQKAAGAKDRTDLVQMLKALPWAMAYVAPRGVGPTRWNQDEKVHTQILRRYYLLGQTWEGMQTYDIRRSMQAVRALSEYAETPLWLQAESSMGVLALYASLFEPPVKRLDLHQLPASHQPAGPALLNVLKTLDIPQVVALAGDQQPVVLYHPTEKLADFAVATGKALNWPEKQIQVRRPPMMPE